VRLLNQPDTILLHESKVLAWSSGLPTSGFTSTTSMTASLPATDTLKHNSLKPRSRQIWRRDATQDNARCRTLTQAGDVWRRRNRIRRINWKISQQIRHDVDFDKTRPISASGCLQRSDWTSDIFSNQHVLLLHFAWSTAEAKCILATAVCVSVFVCLCVCPSPHSHTLQHGSGCNLGEW